MEIKIDHNRQDKRFETIVEGVKGYVEYKEYPGGLDLAHTIVPKAIGGRGVAAALVKYVLEYARKHNLKVKPTCSYVRVYMQRHKDEYGDLEDKIETKFPVMDGMFGHACGSDKSDD
jgi:predicted GNAT family acetyltransferase